MTMNDQDFDRKARKLYTDAARETPEAIRQRLRTVLAAPRPSRQAWQPLVAFASVAVFAVGGLWLQRPMTPATGPAPTATAVVAQSVATQIAGTPPVSAKNPAASTTAPYDNDPEFYAWLGKEAPPVPGE